MSESAQPYTEFPQFLMSVDGARTFMPIGRAGAVFNSYLQKVSIVGLVQEANGNVRDITPEERDRIRQIADQCDADK
jgi:ribosomal protein S19E (S16A)